ncbi:unnamed protein product [Kuraishia capsulata CBS 1993]|uniref:DOC domain-containing protein n=1 Tax=Kuraishia capsulata CBS 1993 TaxID=1382522 RepID=W6MM91_9ASCO|nr:uncharacterized protein KUCA_T00003296001 [Kuraishia capsulata CBS 1993]CDK27318.1 unnamed protein product [Kuraishia capsulata CBS 1993]
MSESWQDSEMDSRDDIESTEGDTRLDASRLDASYLGSSEHINSEEDYEDDEIDGDDVEVEYDADADDRINVAFENGLNTIESWGLVDIGNLAHWSVSSFKQGCGIKELREDNPFSYWQSDALQPHFIEIHFTKKISIERLSLFMDYKSDESYTPLQITVFAGSGEHDLAEVKTSEFVEPSGWEHIVFEGIRHDNLLKCFYLKIVFLSNHQNGKDTHVRCLKVLAPVSKTSMSNNAADLGVSFTSSSLISESVLR